MFQGLQDGTRAAASWVIYVRNLLGWLGLGWLEIDQTTWKYIELPEHSF